MKRELLSLQLSQGSAHPKLLELVRLVTVWRNQERSTRREKVGGGGRGGLTLFCYVLAEECFFFFFKSSLIANVSHAEC